MTTLSLLWFTASMTMPYSHLYLPADAALVFGRRWKPQSVAGSIVSTSGVNSYAKARIRMQSKECVGAILQCVDARYNMYIIEHSDRGHVLLSCILWHTNHEMLNDMGALREWYNATFPDDLYGDALDDEIERKAWYSH